MVLKHYLKLMVSLIWISRKKIVNNICNFESELNKNINHKRHAYVL